jgi:hypothetical protein
MITEYNIYSKLYVNNKRLLFPLIEKYSGISMKGMTHSQAIQEYINLLNNNQAFNNDVNILIKSKGYKNALDMVTGAEDVVSSLFGFLGASANKTSQANAELTDVILSDQSTKNTQVILIMGGITIVSIAIIVLSIYIIAKKRG